MSFRRGRHAAPARLASWILLAVAGCGGTPSARSSGLDAGSLSCGGVGAPDASSPGDAASAEGGATPPSYGASFDVPGGTFYRSYDGTFDNCVELAADGGAGGLGAPATVSPFRLDEYLVTVGRFRPFVDAVTGADGGLPWRPPAGSGKHTHLNGGLGLLDVGAPADAANTYETGWLGEYGGQVAPTSANLACNTASTWTATAGSQESLPVNCVNWYEAYAFCIWDGGFLPSLAEWEYAAAGGSEQRVFPWGLMDSATFISPSVCCPIPTPSPGPNCAVELTTDCAHAIHDCCYPNGAGRSATGSCPGLTTNIAPVGSAALGVARWGQLDMAGEVVEWTVDWYAPYVDPCVDCAQLTGPAKPYNGYGPARATRGGAWPLGATELVPSALSDDFPQARTDGTGFRCARSPK